MRDATQADGTLRSADPKFHHFGVYQFGWGQTPPRIDDLIDLITEAETIGFDSIQMPWHFTVDPEGFAWGNRALLDPLVLLPFLAARTRNINIAITPFTTSVMHPFFWARYLTSLQNVSGDRLIATVRETSSAEDFRIGLTPSDRAAERFDQGIDAFLKLLDGQTLSSDPSDLWDVAGLSLEPQPATRMPLWVHGIDERAIQRAARWGDYLRPVFGTTKQISSAIPRLARASEQFGREVKIANSVICVVVNESDQKHWVNEQIYDVLASRLRGRDPGDSLMIGSADYCAARMQNFFDLGVDYLLLDTQFHGWQSTSFSIEQMHRIAEQVLPQVDPTASHSLKSQA